MTRLRIFSIESVTLITLLKLYLIEIMSSVYYAAGLVQGTQTTLLTTPRRVPTRAINQSGICRLPVALGHEYEYLFLLFPPCLCPRPLRGLAQGYPSGEPPTPPPTRLHYRLHERLPSASTCPISLRYCRTGCAFHFPLCGVL